MDTRIFSFILPHLWAFSIAGRGRDGARVRRAQRDDALNLNEFERVAFQMSRRVLLDRNNGFSATGDELTGTR